jgi:hypothetical protein
MGSWRPDFLVEDYRCSDGTVVEENFTITEINARFLFNGFMHEAYGQKALNESIKDMGSRAAGLVGATDPEMVLTTLPELPSLPYTNWC